MGQKEAPHFLVPGFFSESEIDIQDPKAVLVKDRDFCPVVAELVNNCLNKGATIVTVKIEMGRLVVEDDVKHEPDEIVIILANLNSKKPRTTKPLDPEWGFPIGRVGIVSCRSILEGYNGLLFYEATQDRRIRAVVTWNGK